MQHRFVADVADKLHNMLYNMARKYNKCLRALLIFNKEEGKIKKKIVLFLTVVIAVLTVVVFSACSSISITVDGKKLKYPDSIKLWRVGLYCPFSEITSRKEIEKVYSFFDGAEFVLSDEELTEADGNINFEESVMIRFGKNTYNVSVAENGKAECCYNDKHYITTEGAVDYNALKAYVDNKIQQHFDNIERGNKLC